MSRAPGMALCLGALVLLAAPGEAKLKVTGKGKAQKLVKTQFPADMQPRYDLFSDKCTQCHAMSRPISALVTGVTPVSGDSFQRGDIKRYVVKMMRKPNSGITRDDARQLLKFLIFARKKAEE